MDAERAPLRRSCTGRPARLAGRCRPLWALLVLLVLWLAGARSASADIRLWQDPDEDEAGEEVADPERFFDFTGFIQAGYIVRLDDEDLDQLPEDDHFWIRRARLGFRTQLFDWLSLRLELETSPTPSLTDAFADLSFHPAFNIRVGQFQLAFLRTFQFYERDTAFIDRLVYVSAQPDRAFLRYLTPRDIGLMVNGLVGDIGAGPVLQYWAGLFLGRGPNQTRDPDGAFLFNLRLQLHVFGVPEGVEAESDLAYNERPRLAFGAAAYANCDDRQQFNRGFTVDTEFRWRGLFAYASFVRFVNGPSDDLGEFLGYDSLTSADQVDGDYEFDATGCPGIDSDERAALNSEAARRQASGGDLPVPELIPEHIAWGASFQVQYILPELLFPLSGQALEVLFRFDLVDPNSPTGGFLGGGPGDSGYRPPGTYNDSDNPPSQYRLTFGLNWFPTREQQIRLSLNYQHKRETENVPVGDRVFQGIRNDILWLQLTAGI